MSNRNYDYRQAKRYAKGLKRIREDRAQHGADQHCPCFEAEVDKGKGKVFDRFATTPKDCNHWICSSRAKGKWAESHFIPDE